MAVITYGACLHLQPNHSRASIQYNTLLLVHYSLNNRQVFLLKNKQPAVIDLKPVQISLYR